MPLQHWAEWNFFLQIEKKNFFEFSRYFWVFVTSWRHLYQLGSPHMMSESLANPSFMKQLFLNKVITKNLLNLMRNDRVVRWKKFCILIIFLLIIVESYQTLVLHKLKKSLALLKFQVMYFSSDTVFYLDHKAWRKSFVKRRNALKVAYFN